MSDISLIYKQIESKHPKLVFLSGKTSTGKTTMSNKLRTKYNCAIIELDEIIYRLDCPEGKNRFIEAYQKRDDKVITNSFVQATRQEIRSALENHDFVIIEGAIVNVETLNEIISDWRRSFLFIYLDIKNIDIYAQRLTNRFEMSSPDDGNGLPGLFWEKFSPEILKTYYENRELTSFVRTAIRAYAVDSAKASTARLDRFSSHFDNILEIKV